MLQSLRVLCFGDVVGRPGRNAIQAQLRNLRVERNCDLVIANGENAAGGLGIDASTADELIAAGVDVITLGDHTWHHKEFGTYLDKNSSFCIRPANYPEGVAGRGWTIFSTKTGIQVGVMNLMGRVFMGHLLDCPFRCADRLIEGPLGQCEIVICDMHAEASSEKVAIGRYLDGRVSLLFGTHTHVQTADNHIMSGGEAYITDLGMCGGIDGVIGMDAEVAIERFTSAIPRSYKIATGPGMISGVCCDIDTTTGKALAIERIWQVVE